MGLFDLFKKKKHIINQKSKAINTTISRDGLTVLPEPIGVYNAKNFHLFHDIKTKKCHERKRDF